MHNSCLNPGLKKNKARSHKIHFGEMYFILGKIQWGKYTHCKYVIHCFINTFYSMDMTNYSGYWE